MSGLMVIKKYIPALTLLLFISVGAGLVQAQDDPTISLVKTLIIKEYAGRKITADEYVVERGDSVAKILRRRKVIGPGPVSREVLHLVQSLNPELADPNLIYPGQKLILPIGPVEGPPLEPPGKEAAAEPERPSPPAEVASPQVPEPSAETKAPSASEAKYKVHVVAEGERLSQLLRNLGVPEDLIFNEYINLTVKLNPNLGDPNLIYAGQTLKLPVPGAWAESAIAELAAEEKVQTPPHRPAVSPTATKLDQRRQEAAEKEPPQPAAPPPAMPPSPSLAARTALTLIFSRIGERVISTGQLFLPLKSGGQISLNAHSFPIIEMKNDLRIVLDLEERLPQEMVGLIRANWANYIVFRPKPGEGLPSMLERLFELGRYYKILSQGAPWMLSREIKVEIKADFIIWPTREEWVAGQPVVITLPASRREGTAPEAAAYLGRHGVKVIDFYPQGNLIGPEPRRSGEPVQTAVEKWTLDNDQKFIQALLGLLGQKYEADLSIPLIKSTGTGEDFEFTIQAPIYFSRAGRNFVVIFNGLSDNLISLLKSHGFEVVIRSPGESAQSLAQRLSQAMGLRTETGLTIKASTRPDSRNIELIFPGLMIDRAGGRLFLTPADIPAELKPLLAEKDLKVIWYEILS